MLPSFKERNTKIFKRYSSGESVKILCEAFNLSRSRIEDIIRQMTWSKLLKRLDKKGLGPNFLTTTIQDLSLSTQTVNKLFRYGVYTIADLEIKLPDIEDEKYLSKNITNTIKNNIETLKNRELKK